MLTLPIKRKYFDMIASRIKKEEYRNITPYYAARFKKLGSSFPLRYRAGYSEESPLMECNVVLTQGIGVEEWGAERGVIYYVLSIISVEILHD